MIDIGGIEPPPSFGGNGRILLSNSWADLFPVFVQFFEHFAF
tara:strand:+ start:5736 stop:5861 length:126 start_codon:yes stop_codon:yes gene_type:complete